MDSDRDPEKNLSAYIDRNHVLVSRVFMSK